MKTIVIFCQVYDFWKEFQAEWTKVLLSSRRQHRRRKHRLCLSEVMTIVLLFHFSRYRTFKDFTSNKL